MGAFEYLSALISIVLGLGITHLLMGFGRRVEGRMDLSGVRGCPSAAHGPLHPGVERPLWVHHRELALPQVHQEGGVGREGEDLVGLTGSAAMTVPSSISRTFRRLLNGSEYSASRVRVA